MIVIISSGCRLSRRIQLLAAKRLPVCQCVVLTVCEYFSLFFFSLSGKRYKSEYCCTFFPKLILFVVYKAKSDER